jgi:hypothetical protein
MKCPLYIEIMSVRLWPVIWAYTAVYSFKVLNGRLPLKVVWIFKLPLKLCKRNDYYLKICMITRCVVILYGYAFISL